MGRALGKHFSGFGRLVYGQCLWQTAFLFRFDVEVMSRRTSIGYCLNLTPTVKSMSQKAVIRLLFLFKALFHETYLNFFLVFIFLSLNKSHAALTYILAIFVIRFNLLMFSGMYTEFT